MSNAYNPGDLYEDGRFYLYERTAGYLQPHHCFVGLLESQDGIHFRHLSDKPVLNSEMVGYPYGSVQDPRVVRIADNYYMTFASRRFAWNISPTGLGAPDSSQAQFPGFEPSTDRNQTRSGIAISKDRLHWEFIGWATPEQVDDRDVILFPEKINGRFALLRRPIGFVDTDTGHSEEHTSILISYSTDLRTWREPEVVIRPQFKWEDNRIGGSTPPLRTEHGWLVLSTAMRIPIQSPAGLSTGWGRCCWILRIRPKCWHGPAISSCYPRLSTKSSACSSRTSSSQPVVS